jgi:hypothetical protein
MSAVVQHTTILIKDLDFKAKYNLSHTQTDLMAYIANVPYWADNVMGYYVLATNKILSDLPFLPQKTFEASLKVLKDLGLVECKIVKVTHWRGSPYIRGIRLTEKGNEYNQHLMLPNQEKRINEFAEENRELKETIAKLRVELEEKKTKEVEKVEELKEEISKTPKEEIEKEEPKEDKLNEFIQKNIKYFGATSRPICNFVPTYQKETTFYINSYNKLSTIAQSGESKQIANPQIVYEFWQWLFINQTRVGDKIDFSKTPTFKQLEARFINRTIKIGEEKLQISSFVKEGDSVKIKVKEKEGKERFLLNGETKEAMLFELGYCQRVLLEVLIG